MVTLVGIDFSGEKIDEKKKLRTKKRVQQRGGEKGDQRRVFLSK